MAERSKLRHYKEARLRPEARHDRCGLACCYITAWAVVNIS
jgi:hypothetical protein